MRVFKRWRIYKNYNNKIEGQRFQIILFDRKKVTFRYVYMTLA